MANGTVVMIFIIMVLLLVLSALTYIGYMYYDKYNTCAGNIDARDSELYKNNMCEARRRDFQKKEIERYMGLIDDTRFDQAVIDVKVPGESGQVPLVLNAEQKAAVKVITGIYVDVKKSYPDTNIWGPNRTPFLLEGIERLCAVGIKKDIYLEDDLYRKAMRVLNFYEKSREERERERDMGGYIGEKIEELGKEYINIEKKMMEVNPNISKEDIDAQQSRTRQKLLEWLREKRYDTTRYENYRFPSKFVEPEEP